MKKIILLSFMIIFSSMLYADDEVETEVVDGTTWYYKKQYAEYVYINGQRVGSVTNAIVVAGDEKYTGDLVIPSRLGGFDVSIIGGGAFRYCTELKTVTISTGVTQLDSKAFYGCAALKSIIIPESVVYIGQETFAGCSKLLSIAIPKGVTCIEYGLFSDCSVLRSVIILGNITMISADAFKECSALVNLTIPESVVYIGASAFKGCTSLNNVILPASITELKSETFSCCLSLTNIVFSTNLTTVGKSVFYRCTSLENVILPCGLTSISERMFDSCSSLKNVVIPESVTSIGEYAFVNCSLSDCVIPRSVVEVGALAFHSEYPQRVVFEGAPPAGYLVDAFRYAVSYPREYGAAWQSVICNINKFSGYSQLNKPEVEYVSVMVREDDPTVLDCVYCVKSDLPTVRVRALAFQDGERSFAKVMMPETFIEDTGVNVGDTIAANEEHKLSWRVSSDWMIDLAKVKFEILAIEEDLLPLELVTIPANGTNTAMEISWNVISETQVFDALLWLYADKSEGLTLADGGLYYNGKLTAKGTTVYSGKTATQYYSRQKVNGVYEYVYYANGIDVVYEKMGFSTLSGDKLDYANSATRLGLSPSGVRQYAYRMIDEE